MCVGWVTQRADEGRTPCQALVKSYPAVFKRAYVDRTQRIVINVGGVRHETRMATFMKYPNSRLGRRFAKGMGLADGDKELFFDRDPGAFGVVLNYCRTGKLLVPMSVNEEAVSTPSYCAAAFMAPRLSCGSPTLALCRLPRSLPTLASPCSRFTSEGRQPSTRWDA